MEGIVGLVLFSEMEMALVDVGERLEVFQAMEDGGW